MLAALRMASSPLPLSASASDVDRVHDGFDEVVEGAGVGAWAEAQDVFGGPLGADFAPLGDFVGEDLGELFLGDIGEEVILAADDHSQGVGADAELNRGAVDGSAVLASCSP